MNTNAMIGLLIPFIGTTLGSAMVFFMKSEINVKLEKLLLVCFRSNVAAPYGLY